LDDGQQEVLDQEADDKGDEEKEKEEAAGDHGAGEGDDEGDEDGGNGGTRVRGVWVGRWPDRVRTRGVRWLRTGWIMFWLRSRKAGWYVAQNVKVRPSIEKG